MNKISPITIQDHLHEDCQVIPRRYSKRLNEYPPVEQLCISALKFRLFAFNHQMQLSQQLSSRSTSNHFTTIQYSPKNKQAQHRDQPRRKGAKAERLARKRNEEPKKEREKNKIYSFSRNNNQQTAFFRSLCKNQSGYLDSIQLHRPRLIEHLRQEIPEFILRRLLSFWEVPTAMNFRNFVTWVQNVANSVNRALLITFQALDRQAKGFLITKDIFQYFKGIQHFDIENLAFQDIKLLSRLLQSRPSRVEQSESVQSKVLLNHEIKQSDLKLMQAQIKQTNKPRIVLLSSYKTTPFYYQHLPQIRFKNKKFQENSVSVELGQALAQLDSSRRISFAEMCEGLGHSRPGWLRQFKLSMRMA